MASLILLGEQPTLTRPESRSDATKQNVDFGQIGKKKKGYDKGEERTVGSIHSSPLVTTSSVQTEPMHRDSPIGRPHPVADIEKASQCIGVGNRSEERLAQAHVHVHFRQNYSMDQGKQ